MAISVTHRETNGSTTNGTSYTTGSVLMTAGNLVLIWTAQSEGGTAVDPDTVASSSVSFTKIRGSAMPDTNNNLTLWGAVPGSTVTETITIDFTTSGSQASCMWSVIDIAGVDVSGGVAGAVVQSAEMEGTGSPAQVTLSAFADAANRAFAAFYMTQVQETVTAGTDFTILGQHNMAETNTMASEWRSDAADTGPDVSWPSGGLVAGIGAEIAVLLATAKKLGYGGIANTAGARDFSSKSTGGSGEPPTNGAILAISQHQIDTSVTNNAPNAIHEWDRQKQGGNWIFVGTTASGVATFRHEGLERLQGYNFRARAVQSGVDNSYLDIGSGKTLAAPNALHMMRR